MLRKLAIALVGVLVVGITPAVSLADHEDGWYELPALDMWTKSHLVVVIVPPAHGQIYNGNGALNGGDPNELNPYAGSYLKAMEDSIREWNRGINMFGSKRLRREFKADVYVLGRDDVPDQGTWDILVTTDPNKGFVLGFALRTEPCIVNNSMMLTRSFTYADMYNVMGQEYGHCLGLQHVGSQGGVEPTSEQKHPEHDVMNGFYADPVGNSRNHLHCVSNLDVEGLEYTFSTLTGAFDQHVVHMHVDKYRTTCGGDGRPSPESRKVRGSQP